MWNSQNQSENKVGNILETCVVNENNLNLTPPQKELLCWHFHLCHQGFNSLQYLLKQATLVILFLDELPPRQTFQHVPQVSMPKPNIS